MLRSGMKIRRASCELVIMHGHRRRDTTQSAPEQGELSPRSTSVTALSHRADALYATYLYLLSS